MLGLGLAKHSRDLSFAPDSMRGLDPTDLFESSICPVVLSAPFCARKELTRFDQDAAVLDRQSDIGWLALKWRGLKLGDGSRSEGETGDLELQPAMQQLFRTRILPKRPP